MSPLPHPNANPFDAAKALFVEGLGHFEEQRFDAAERCFTASLERLPGRVSTLVNLAATQLQLARPLAALATTDALLAHAPDTADGWLHRGNALAALGRHDDALASFDRLLALAPTLAVAWSHRGSLLRETLRLDEAAAAFRRAIECGADPHTTGYYLASVGVGAAPDIAPARYVETLFDDYASTFDEHLVQVLGYRGHVQLTGHLERLAHRRFRSALDLGCGTGLCGALLRPTTEQLTGIDLSAGMLAKARALGVYDELVQADIVAALHARIGRHDLALAADVFIYIGDLSAVFSAVHEVLEPGGVFCFSTEISSRDDVDFELLPSLRYAHSPAYLRALAARHGFDVIDLIARPVREDQQRNIDAMFTFLARR